MLKLLVMIQGVDVDIMLSVSARNVPFQLAVEVGDLYMQQTERYVTFVTFTLMYVYSTPLILS